VKTKHQFLRIAALLVVLLPVYSDIAAEEGAKTVLGPRNVYLAEGARALLAGDGEEGVRLTMLGLNTAIGNQEKTIALSNLCAGYLLLRQPTVALGYCDEVLEMDSAHWRGYNNRALAYLQLGRYEESEADVRRGQALRPGSRKLKIVKGLLLDETQPVRESIEIDERRDPDESDDETGKRD
jgi:tetratricopeptide (TPR) repeat protein